MPEREERFPANLTRDLDGSRARVGTLPPQPSSALKTWLRMARAHSRAVQAVTIPTVRRPLISPLISLTAWRMASTGSSAARACASAADPAVVAAIYEQDAVMAYPPGQVTVGRDAIQALWEKILASGPHFEQEPPLPTLISGDIALTSTPPKDAAGARAQVCRRQADGTWQRLLDQPEFVSVARAIP